ncbi:hypothetical protein FLL45_21745 [Aliikangiella marina]|uniref:Uncharacterized protein n=1 Tax=Aliikangiella marina TaxID=1712262 RepID=A0A545T160_9GAMM|nr:hypothetical protein [Aliikangiella marina]TQV70953.1 hypothetical protein FLL45_21745 [Aliikangiella marina]
MVNRIIIAVVIIAILGIGYIFISGDTENRVARLGVSYFDGDYVITYHGYSGVDVWMVKSGKVTSEPSKGYYHTRVRTKDGKTAYMQLPISNTVIEEFKEPSQLTKAQRAILVGKYGYEYFPPLTNEAKDNQ